MNKLFVSMQCMSVITFSQKDIYECLFDKKEDKRYLDSSIRKFISLNKPVLDFLDLKITCEGTGGNFSMTIESGRFVGSVPIKMPYDGIAHKDLRVIPRYANTNMAYTRLTDLLGVLEFSVKPVYMDNTPLNLPEQLKPPMYIESVKYIQLFEKSNREKWLKFASENKIYSFPKASTQWQKYSVDSADPIKALRYPTHDNVLSQNHTEWQQLIYAFRIACEDIKSSSTPTSIKYKYKDLITRLERELTNIPQKECDSVNVHLSDPAIIKQTKAQANVILRKNTDCCMAWRIDIAELFERYVQYVLGLVAKESAGICYSNHKITGKGFIPSWGLKYLEPDAVVRIGDMLVFCDAKYKSHFLNTDSDSEELKNSHRHDLHQLLAYCSFSPSKNKLGILCYPIENYRKPSVISYYDNIASCTNQIAIVGLPFDSAKIQEAKDILKKIIHSQ